MQIVVIFDKNFLFVDVFFVQFFLLSFIECYGYLSDVDIKNVILGCQLDLVIFDLMYFLLIVDFDIVDFCIDL